MVSVCPASWIFDTECLDDIYQAYYDGEIDGEVFSLLTGSYDTGGLALNDLEAIGAFERDDLPADSVKTSNNRFWRNFLSPRKGKLGLRRYSKNLDNAVNYYFLNWQLQTVRFSIETEDNNGDYFYKKRWLSFSSNYFDVVLGNFGVAEGCGLAIGRFDYRPSAGMTDHIESDLLYPYNNYYNGIKISARGRGFRGRLYYSKKKYISGRKDFLGSGIDFTNYVITAGIAVGYNKFINETVSDNRLAVGLNLNVKASDFNLSGEYANVEKADGFYLKGERYIDDMILRTELWRYDKNFSSYNSSGPSYSDYNSFYPEEQQLGFRSAQADESGLAVKYIRNNLSFGLMFWSHSRDEKINSSYNFRLQKPALSRYDFFLLSSAKYRQEDSYLWLKAGLMPKENLMIKKAGCKIFLEDKSDLANSKSYAFINFLHDLKGNFTVFLKIRSYFNGQVRWYLGEELISDEGINIIAEAAYYNGVRLNLKFEKLL